MREQLKLSVLVSVEIETYKSLTSKVTKSKVESLKLPNPLFIIKKLFVSRSWMYLNALLIAHISHLISLICSKLITAHLRFFQ